MNTYAVINQKGGIGKTMLATNLSYILAAQKYKVLLIDLDHQANASSMYKPRSTDKLLEDTLCKQNLNLAESIYNAEMNNVKIPNLYIIPSSNQLANKTDELASKMYRETILATKLKKVSKDFDYCIIDCMTTASIFSTNAVYASSNFIVPFTCGRYSIEGLLGLLVRIKEIIQNRKVNYYFVKNLYDKRTTITNAFIENEIKVFEKYICKTAISKSEKINQADITGQPVIKFDKKSNTTKELTKLAREIFNV